MDQCNCNKSALLCDLHGPAVLRIDEDAKRAVRKHEGTRAWLHEYELEMRRRLAIRAQDERED